MLAHALPRRRAPSRLASPRFGRGDARPGSRRRSFEVVPPRGRSGVRHGVGSAVVVELALPVAGYDPKNADVSIAHDRGPRGSGRGTACATLRISWGGSPHLGHATMDAAAARVKRSRQRGQQARVMNDPFDRGPEDQRSAASCLVAGPQGSNVLIELTLRAGLQPRARRPPKHNRAEARSPRRMIETRGVSRDSLVGSRSLFLSRERPSEGWEVPSGGDAAHDRGASGPAVVET